MDHFVEKPKQVQAPSNLAIIGRYILTPEIMDILDNQAVGAGGEIQLTDAIEGLNKTQTVYGYEFEGDRYDVGDQLGFIETTISMALQREDMREDVLEVIQNLLAKESSGKN